MPCWLTLHLTIFIGEWKNNVCVPKLLPQNKEMCDEIKKNCSSLDKKLNKVCVCVCVCVGDVTCIREHSWVVGDATRLATWSPPWIDKLISCLGSKGTKSNACTDRWLDACCTCTTVPAHACVTVTVGGSVRLGGIMGQNVVHWLIISVQYFLINI